MRRISLKTFLILVLCCFAIYIIIRYNFSDDNQEPLNWDYWIANTSPPRESAKIVLSFVVCDGRLNESLNVVKSVLLFTRRPVHLVIFADDIRRSQLNETLTRWRSLTSNQIQFELHRIQFPEPDADFWLNLFRKCSSQRLFFPELLPHVDALVYVDTDTLFLGPLEELWSQFEGFNASHITALAWEHDNPNVAWYPRFAKHPFYGKYGLNSGVMLMNLTRMRQFGWMEYITPVMRAWREHIPWGDQDIVNIILSHHPEAVRVLGCRYNYRADLCALGGGGGGGGACLGRGVLLLHASRGGFYGDAQPAFRACYESVAEHPLGLVTAGLLSRLEERLSRARATPCGALKQAFLKVPEDTLRALRPARGPSNASLQHEGHKAKNIGL